jgi:two-component system, NarL family, sensor histidine kinase DegS
MASDWAQTGARRPWAAISSAALRRRLSAFVHQFRARLHDRRFWVVQILVIAISLGHSLLEETHSLGVLPDLALLPVSTYFIPIVYAALNFGVEGAVPTALWSAILTVPNLILWHSGAQRPGVVLQLALLVAIAYVIARRVDFETAAKQRAEAATARLQDYVRLATDAQEEERKRLARELHDDTIQTLVIAKTELDTLANQTPLPAPASARLRNVSETLAGAIGNVRRFSRDLRPSLLDDLGLVHAIDWLVSDLSSRTGIHTELRTRGQPRRLDQHAEIAVFRIVQEALHNVERHATAQSVRVRLHFNHHVQAVVIDNGQGFQVANTPDTHKASPRLGLRGMRERATLAGATLTINSRPSSGTRVSVTLTRND